MLKTMLQRLRACAKIRWKMWWILAPPMSFAGGASWIHMPFADIQLEKCRKMNHWCKCFVLFVTFSLVFSIVTKNRITSMWPFSFDSVLEPMTTTFQEIREVSHVIGDQMQPGLHRQKQQWSSSFPSFLEDRGLQGFMWFGVFVFSVFFSFRVISYKLEVSVHSDLQILYEGLGGAISCDKTRAAARMVLVPSASPNPHRQEKSTPDQICSNMVE